MSFRIENITSFTGLNSSVAPELLKKGDARDIVNLRMEKIGKLVSRNGYCYGLLSKSDGVSPMPVMMYPPNNPNGRWTDGLVEQEQNTGTRQSMAYVNNLGIIGIGEVILSEKFDKFDTDRFMVYCVRGAATDLYETRYSSNSSASDTPHSFIQDSTMQSSPASPYRHRAMYLLAPVTGRYRNRLMLHPWADINDAEPWLGYVADRCLEDAYGDINNTPTDADPLWNSRYDLIYAPNRFLPAYMDPEEEDAPTGNFNYHGWIKHYIDMNQYRSNLIISDRVNGDMRIYDKYDMAPVQSSSNAEHRLVLAKNVETRFDIDKVLLDSRFNANQENDDTAGINTYMALYKYVLPEKEYVVSEDHHSNTLGNPDWFGSKNVFNSTGSFDKIKADGEIDTFLGVLGELRRENGLAVVFTEYLLNLKNKYVFTNAESSGFFKDIFGKLKLSEEEYTNSEGELVKEIASNAYVWKEHSLNYYPSRGMTYNANKYLTDRDRLFDKLTTGVLKASKLKVKDPWERDVPLGVWSYKFIWDYGGGVYSLPSVEILAPDIMWSAVRDEEIYVPQAGTQQGLVSNISEYERPKDISGIEEFMYQYTNYNKININYSGTIGIKAGQYPYSDSISNHKGPSIFYTDSGNISRLTPFGRKLWDLKNAVYSSQHRFGAGDTNDMSISNYPSYMNNTTSAASEINRQNFTTLVTVYFNEYVKLNGIVWEGCYVDTNKGLEFDEMSWASSDETWHVENFGHIVIPVFKKPGDYKTYNSLFDDYGRLRLAYKDYNQLILPGVNSGVGHCTSDGTFYYNFNSNTDYDKKNNVSTMVLYGWVKQIAPSDKDLYLNIVGVEGDANNTNELTGKIFYGEEQSPWQRAEKRSYIVESLLDYSGGAHDLYLHRTNTLVRGVKKEDDKLNVAKQIDSEAVSRLILEGIAEIQLQDDSEEVSFESELDEAGDTLLSPDRWRQKVLIKEYAKTINTVPTWNTGYGDVLFSTDPIRGTGTLVMPSGSYSLYDYSDRLKRLSVTNVIKIKIGNSFGDVFSIPVGEDVYLTLVKLRDKDGNMLSPIKCTIIRSDRNSGEVEIGVISTVDIYILENTYSIDQSGGLYVSGAQIVYYPEEDPNAIGAGLDIRIYGEAQRFIGIEQLTSYFPSSVLFNSPRLGIKIPRAQVPSQAKRLLIFRTKSSHSNDYIPSAYGLVARVDIERDSNNNVVTKMEDNINTSYQDGYDYKGLYFFDDIKDSELNFTENPDSYEGIDRVLHSRFNTNVNERVYYANALMRYQPAKPRSEVTGESSSDIDTTDAMFLDAEEYESDPSSFFTSGKYLTYKYLYVDTSGIKSEASQTVFLATEDSPYTKTWIGLSFVPYGYNDGIERVEIYRREYPTGSFFYIGELEAGSEGVFVDKGVADDRKVLDESELIPTNEDFESGVFWSEPYRPGYILPDSFVEYGSGDGDQITGLQVLYGNLIVLKENSIHRSALLGQDIPITRTDTIDPDIGLIAPNAVVNVNNTLYFLSWKGFIKYDNNVLEKIDAPFSEELQFILANTDKDLIRDATCGYNPVYDEIWLNIPMLPTLHNDGRQDIYGEGKMIRSGNDNSNVNYYERKIYGHIYIYSPTKQYFTKFSNQASVLDPRNTDVYLREVVDPRQMIRMYYTNSIGEMRSADILPSYHGTDATQDPMWDPEAMLHAGIYVETPYSNLLGVPAISDEDEILNHTVLSALFEDSSSYVNWTWGIASSTAAFFPAPRRITNAWSGNDMNDRPSDEFSVLTPVLSVFKSKYFTGSTESMIKRVREANFNIFSRGPITIRARAFPYETQNSLFADDRIDDSTGDWATTVQSLAQETFLFNPSVSGIDSITLLPIGQAQGLTAIGTGSNMLSIIPRFPGIIGSDRENDWYGKPIRFSVEIESSYRIQINSFNIYWRPIHSYLE